MRRIGTAMLVVALGVSGCVAGDADPPPESTVEILGPYRGREAELFAASLEPFEEATGISIRYTGTGSFVSDLRAQVQAGAAPDIAMIPQPGLVAQLTRSGDVLPLGPEALAAVDANYGAQARALADVDGETVGVPFRVSLKSLVWYRPSVFEARGLEIPTTLAELDELAQQIVDQGTAPWCFGLEAEGSTGWAATDWTEDLVLRLDGPDVYDQWTSGEIPFSDPEIGASFELFRDLVLTPGRVNGGIAGVLRTPVHDSPAGLFADPVECVLHRQASFAFGWMPSGLEFGPDGDIDFFILPDASADEAPPLLLGSDLAVAFDDSPDVDAVMAHLATPESTREWSAAGGYTSPRATAELSELPPVDRAVLEAILAADTIRVDASDTMPPAIGSDLLWREITDWVADRISYEEFADTLDRARAGQPG